MKRALLTGALLTLLPSSAWAQLHGKGAHEGARHHGGVYVGSVTLTTTRDGWVSGEDAQDQEVRDVYGMMVETAALPLETPFGARAGFELGAGLGLPSGDSFFGGFRFQAGILVMPLVLGPLRAGAAAGVGVGGHRYAYLAPEASLGLGGLHVRASYKWTPPSTSRIAGLEQGLGDRGYEERRLRGEVFLRLSQPYDLFDGDVESYRGVRIYVERSEVSAPDESLLIEENVAAGTYWGAGLGYAF